MKNLIIILIVLIMFSCNNEKDSLHKEYYNNGKIKKEIHFKAGQADGLATFYYESGSINSIGYFKNGKAEGKWVRYFESPSTVMSIENYILGERQGVCYRFYISGYLHGIENYNNDTLCGTMTQFYNNIDMIHLYIPEIKSNGDANKYIEYDSTGEPRYLKSKDGRPLIRIRTTVDKVSL